MSTVRHIFIDSKGRLFWKDIPRGQLYHLEQEHEEVDIRKIPSNLTVMHRIHRYERVWFKIPVFVDSEVPLRFRNEAMESLLSVPVNRTTEEEYGV